MGLGVTQLPLPLQVGAAVNCDEPEAQMALPPQAVPPACCWQPKEPLQRPVLPQVALTGHWPAGAATPEAIAAQVPRPLRLHEPQVPQPFVWQQTPSVQKPLAHSSPEPQAVFSPFLGLQTPFEAAVQ
jgi:hypothetical protein